MARDTGRPVRIASLSFPVGTGPERVAEAVDAEGARRLRSHRPAGDLDGTGRPRPRGVGRSDRHPDERAGTPPRDLHRMPHRSHPGNDRSDRGNAAAEHRGPDRPPGEDRRQLRQGVSLLVGVRRDAAGGGRHDGAGVRHRLRAHRRHHLFRREFPRSVAAAGRAGGRAGDLAERLLGRGPACRRMR